MSPAPRLVEQADSQIKDLAELASHRQAFELPELVVAAVLLVPTATQEERIRAAVGFAPRSGSSVSNEGRDRPSL